MTYDDPKYAVFKANDVHWADDGSAHVALQAVLDDAVVIRLQDAFAPPALDAYANSIITAVEAATVLLAGLPDDAQQTLQAQIKGLRGIADFFSEQAAKSWSVNRHLPD